MPRRSSVCSSVASLERAGAATTMRPPVAESRSQWAGTVTAPASSDPAHEVVIAPTRGWPALRLDEIATYRELLYFLVWRDVKVRYKQTALGVAWAVLQPLLTVFVFTVFFNRVGHIEDQGRSLRALLPERDDPVALLRERRDDRLGVGRDEREPRHEGLLPATRDPHRVRPVEPPRRGDRPRPPPRGDGRLRHGASSRDPRGPAYSRARLRERARRVALVLRAQRRVPGRSLRRAAPRSALAARLAGRVQHLEDRRGPGRPSWRSIQ